MFFPYALRKVNRYLLLTRPEWDRLKLIPPLLGDLDHLVGFSMKSCSSTLLIRMADESLGIIKHERIHHIEKVRTVREAALRELVREVQHEVIVLFHVWPQVNHGQLIVHRNIHSLHLVEAHQLFIPLQHLLEEVFVHPRYHRCQN